MKKKTPKPEKQTFPKEEALESTDLNILSIRALPIEKKKRSPTPWNPISPWKTHIIIWYSYIITKTYLHYKEQIIPKIWSYHQARLGKPLGLPWSVAINLMAHQHAGAVWGPPVAPDSAWMGWAVRWMCNGRWAMEDGRLENIMFFFAPFGL